MDQYAIAVFVARVFLGILFFIQGYDAIFKVKLTNIVYAFESELSGKGIPRFLIIGGVYFTSFIQLIGGALLITGFIKYYALYFLGLNILLVSVTFGIIKPMWDMQFVFPRLVLLIALMLFPATWDTISVDHHWSLFRSPDM